MSPVVALTSLSPAHWRVAAQRETTRSWRDAGLRVCSLNHPSEIARLRGLYEVEWVPVAETAVGIFGRHFIPISAALAWAAAQDTPALLINADIELRLAPWEMKRIRWLADGGLCYFVRYNHDGDLRQAARALHGLDAFLLNARDASIAESFLSFGQPFWDYLFPYLFAKQDRPVCAVEFPAAFHRNHPQQWSWTNWHRCAIEFGRITGSLNGDRSGQACTAMAEHVCETFTSKKIALAPAPMEIRAWVERTFAGDEPETFLELGSHRGTDTEWMAALSGVTIHAFEPDPRNRQPPRPNVLQTAAAISDHDGRAPFILSREGWGQEWTHSSSLRQPKNHLERYPVTFGETIGVETITLDTYCRREGLGHIDFLWADIQGSEGEMIRGGRECLARTRYLYTEFSDDELYAGQATLRDILALLPDFRVIEMWPEDVLLENQRLKQ